ncbi:unnamed protein product [Closterium sp. NIES-54]
MEITRTSMIHAPYAVCYTAQQLNLWHRVSQPGASPTSLWTGSPGVASEFRVWGCLVLVLEPLRTSSRLAPSPAFSLVSQYTLLTLSFTTRPSTGSSTLVTSDLTNLCPTTPATLVEVSRFLPLLFSSPPLLLLLPLLRYPHPLLVLPDQLEVLPLEVLVLCSFYARSGGVVSGCASFRGAGARGAGTGGASLGGARAVVIDPGGRGSGGAGLGAAGTGGASSEETGAKGTTIAEPTTTPHRYDTRLQALRRLEREEQRRLEQARQELHQLEQQEQHL